MFASLSKTNVRTFGGGEASWCTCDLTSKVSVKKDDYSLHACMPLFTLCASAPSGGRGETFNPIYVNKISATLQTYFTHNKRMNLTSAKCQLA